MGWVEYAKPGINLTKLAIKTVGDNKVDILILANHGLVVGADNCSEIDILMNDIILRCNQQTRLLPDYTLESLLSVRRMESTSVGN